MSARLDAAKSSAMGLYDLLLGLHPPGHIPTAPDSLTLQVAALREEIQALRRDLAPQSSTILTGREAMAEFQRLKGTP
jgi:hypothetical protein